MKKRAQKRTSNVIRFCHFQSWRMQTIAMDFIWWVSAKCRNCFWPWGFLNRQLECALFLMSQFCDCEEHSHNTLFCALALMCVLNCLLHINFGSRSLLHCYDAMICGLTWVYPISTNYSICKPVHYSYGCDMPAGDSEWSKVYTSEVLKGYFTQCICWNLYYAVHTLPIYSLTVYSWYTPC